MSLSHLPCRLSSWFCTFADHLHLRSGTRLLLLFVGILFASRRRTVTSWFRAAGITTDFRPGYTTVAAVGRRVPSLASRALAVAQTILPPGRLTVAIDDTPTPRYGRCVEGAGIHHNPSPGPAGEAFVYGHVFVMLAAIAKHPRWGTTAWPLWSQLYIRQADIDQLPPQRQRPFRTKLELAAEQLRWLKTWAGRQSSSIWVLADGGYAKRPFLRAAREQDIVVVSRLRKDAALRSMPPTVRRPNQRGPMPTYGKERIDLAKRAGQKRGWEQVECVQYNKRVVKTIKTFVATYRPAGGAIRVVIVQEEHGWLPFFSTDPEATVAEVLEGAADRGSIEQTNKDVKEVWGAGQQQLRNVDANEGAFNLNGWMYSMVEAWAWEKEEEELVDRSESPWDEEARRPSHAEKRKALQREVLREEIEAVMGEGADPGRFRELAERLLRLAA
jgi:DDE superfamily endonuclease